MPTLQKIHQTRNKHKRQNIRTKVHNMKTKSQKIRELAQIQDVKRFLLTRGDQKQEKILNEIIELEIQMEELCNNKEKRIRHMDVIS